MPPKKQNQNKGKLPRRSLTVADLGAFSEEVLLPGIEKMFDQLKVETRKGFQEVNTSIKTLTGEIIEMKVREEDQNHEARIKRVEEKVGIRPSLR